MPVTVVRPALTSSVDFGENHEFNGMSATEAFAAPPDQLWLHFAVADTGIGIASDKQGLIFDPFVQADGSMTRKYGGTGLGLAISGRLVEMMGGRIGVESQVGKGSTFHFTAQFSRATGSRVIRLPARPENLIGLRVLIVDDNATNRRILEEMLTNWHMIPTVVESCELAMSAMEEAKNDGMPFPLVLTDAQMPDHDGFELAERIKTHPDLARATIMMLSSAGLTGDRTRCRELGVAGYLTKPVKQSELMDAILRLLGKPIVEQVTAASVDGATARADARSLRILLAEDNPVNQKVARHILEKSGHSVTVAGDGREAVMLFDHQPFDLILMDVQMPYMDGFEATAAIRRRELEKGTHTPIIALTAHAMKGDRERCLSAGCDGYVAKPIQVEELLAAVAEVTPSGPPMQVERHEAPAAQASANGRQEEDIDLATAGIDRAALLSRVGGDPELLRDVILLFLKDCPRMLAEVNESLRNQDAAQLRRAAHCLKGTVGNFTAGGAFTAAWRLEMMGRDGNMAGVEQVWSELRAELERLQPALASLASPAESVAT
jgi:CheY-like chemotaxis protein